MIRFQMEKQSCLTIDNVSEHTKNPLGIGFIFEVYVFVYVCVELLLKTENLQGCQVFYSIELFKSTFS